EAAALVDVALGEKAQYVVASWDPALVEYLARESSRWPGRVGVVWLDPPGRTPRLPDGRLENHPGVVGRADRFVRTEHQYAELAARLLGHVWIVEDLACALALVQGHGAGQGFVTLAGQRIDPDGSLTLGPRQEAGGLVSRRSELRALRGQSEELRRQIADAGQKLRNLEEQIAEDEGRRSWLAQQERAAEEALRRHEQKMAAAEEGHSQAERQRQVLDAELRVAAADYQATARSLDSARTEQAALQSALAEMERSVAEQADQIERLQSEQQTRQRHVTETKVELAKSEERLDNLRARMHQFEESQQERLRAITETQSRLEECQQRAAESCRQVLQAESEVAELYLRKEGFGAETVRLVNERERLQAERAGMARQANEARAAVRRLEEQIHTQDLAAGQVRHQRTSLADRLREDYGIELSELEHEPSVEEQHEREAVQQEIDELRRKISNIGNVNLEALEELEQLEARHRLLASQYDDLTRAKAALEQIIDKINVDSRRLFSETLETVRGHFRSLFRDLFGGGQADIVLEEGMDILESGVEIVARPPGKEPRSISLLSGGEKTLTCVALLLAIFRSRPSPFCVLDEVDAALDEANIDRFTHVLKGFLTWTQFIIVTHSKKTMTCANTIYGVTMQESGVSKQVSVRFEDVSDTGEVLLPTEADQPAARGGDEKDEHQAA
ncbi:MAG TPA: chromosome segregation protein SMC, partial [Planctomycetaceae bacterium]|nr:chromosome segregation protein SMC [Planctomycetaceae bacterium]